MKLLNKVSHKIAGITSDRMTPMRTPRIKSTSYAKVLDTGHPEPHPNAVPSSLGLRSYLMSP